MEYFVYAKKHDADQLLEIAKGFVAQSQSAELVASRHE